MVSFRRLFLAFLNPIWPLKFLKGLIFIQVVHSIPISGYSIRLGEEQSPFQTTIHTSTIRQSLQDWFRLIPILEATQFRPTFWWRPCNNKTGLCLRPSDQVRNPNLRTRYLEKSLKIAPKVLQYHLWPVPFRRILQKWRTNRPKIMCTNKCSNWKYNFNDLNLREFFIMSYSHC